MPEPATSAAPAKLDDVMLAMDVVDTLRHREQLVSQELDTGERDDQLLERLRQIYASQGITVSQQILEEGVTALREGRFTYAPPPRSGATRWANIYINRGRWGKAVLALVVVALLATLAYDAAVRAPIRNLRTDLNTVHAAVLAEALVPTADQQADALYQKAVASLARGQNADARDSLTTLKELRTQLEQSYSLRIASSPDTGVYRIPDLNTGARNYYIIVEAIDANGRRLTVPIRNEETGAVESVKQWGLRVDEATYERVRDDKVDDGIIQNDLFGEKRPGYLEPDYLFPTSGAAITEWD